METMGMQHSKHSLLPCTFCNHVCLVSEWMNYDRRSVGQSVSVSSPIWGSRPDINCYLTVTVLFSMSGAPSDARSGLSFVLVTRTASVQFNKFAAGPCQHSEWVSELRPTVSRSWCPILLSSIYIKQKYVCGYVCWYVCWCICWYILDLLFNPLTDNNQIWDINYSEPDEKDRLQKNF
jgi:hypothetical protein